MATFKIATIGIKEDTIFFEQAQKQLNSEYINSDNSIQFIDITNKSENEILEYGALHGVIYFTNIHSSDHANTLKIILNHQEEKDDLSLFSLSHTIVTPMIANKEISTINSYVNNKFGKEGISVFPANINSEEEMKAYVKGFIQTTANTYFNEVTPIQKSTEDKLKETIAIIMSAITTKHNYTNGHLERVSKYAIALADELGLDSNTKKGLAIVSKLHDVGKLGIPDKILDSDKSLSFPQRQEMEAHSTMGSTLLHIAINHSPELSRIIDTKMLQGIKLHHKYWNGKLDPKAPIDPIRGERIGEYASIIAVADCIDAMTSQRAYNNPKHILDTFRDLWSNRDKQFKGDIAEAAIIILSKQIASLGYDPIAMFSNTSPAVPEENTPQNFTTEKKLKYDGELKAFLENNATKFNVNYDLDKNPFCALGFQLDEFGYFIFNETDSPIRDPKIRENDERDFISKRSDRIFLPDGVVLTEENKSSLIENHIKVRFTNQDAEGKAAIARAISKVNYRKKTADEYEDR